MLVAFIMCFVFALVCLMYDALWTSKGLKAGIALEGNGLIDWVWSTRMPNLLQRLLVDIPLRCIFFGMGFIPNSVHPSMFKALAIGAFVAFGIKNIQGARQWQWMFKNPGKTLPVMNTVWQQIIGFWG